MADRSVAVRLRAEVAGYISNIQAAASATRDLQSQVTQNAAENEQAWTEVGTTLLAFGGIAGVAVGVAVAKFAEFDAAISSVQASTRETAENMDLLRDAALDAGATTVFSATEAAQGIDALAKAGVSTADVLNGGLAGALDLAAAGELEVADAAEIAASTLTQFSLAGQDVVRIADLLAAGAGKAQGSVDDIGMALQQTGGIAAQMGLSVEDTVGALAQFASAGYIGSDAGTSFKQMLLSLVPSSVEAADAMAAYGLEFFDASGELKSFTGIAGELQRGLGDLTTEQQASALKTIFGADAYRVAAVALDGGAQAAQEWRDKVDDAGFASEQAALKLDNLTGDIESFGGAVDTALIGAGSDANGILRELVQTGTAMVQGYSALPGIVQTTATGLTVVAAGASIAGGAFLIAAPKVVAFRAAVATMGPAGVAAARGLSLVTGALAGPLGIALVGGVAALALFARSKAETRAEVEAFTSAIKADSGSLGENSRAVAVSALEKRGLLQSAKDLGISLRDLTDAALGEEGAVRRVNAALDEYSVAMPTAAEAGGPLTTGISEMDVAAARLRDELGEVAGSTQKARREAELSAEALGTQAEATGLAGVATQDLGESAVAAAEALDAETAALAEMFEEVQAGTALVLGLRDAQRGFQQALVDAAEARKENGKGLDIETEKGRENAEALDAIAIAANNVIKQLVDSGKPYEEISAALTTQREKLIDAAIAFGESQAGAEAYAASVLRIPSDTATTAQFDAVESLRRIAAFNAELDALDGRVARASVVITEQYNRAAINDGRNRPGLAGGGWVYGPGTGTSDSVTGIPLSNGEFVVNARAAADNADLLQAINSGYARGSVATGASGGASGPSGSQDFAGLRADVQALAAAMPRDVLLDGRKVGEVVGQQQGRATTARMRNT